MRYFSEILQQDIRDGSPSTFTTGSSRRSSRSQTIPTLLLVESLQIRRMTGGFESPNIASSTSADAIRVVPIHRV
jgi:hypothetical protein